MKKETSNFELGKAYINTKNISIIHTTPDGYAFVILTNGQEHKYKLENIEILG